MVQFTVVTQPTHAARTAEHNSGRGAKDTCSRLPVESIYQENFATKSEALKREAALEKLIHAERILLIEQQ
jgi:putative endonuclease